MTISNIIYYLILPIILIIGLIVIYQDFKDGKILNKWIKLGLFLGLVYYFLLIIITVLGYFDVLSIDYYPFEYYGYVLLNTLIAFILGFILWYFKLWAGGDAKLFTLYAFLIPLLFYSASFYKIFPGLNLLINIILPIFIYLIIKMLLYPLQLLWGYLKNPHLVKEYYNKHKKDNKIDKQKIKEYLNAGISFLLILIFFQLLRRKLGYFIEPYLGQLITAAYFFIGFVIFKPLRILLKKYLIITISFVFVYFIIGFIFFKEQLLQDFLQIFALQMIFMMTYFYIFKVGRLLGRFLYNSAEVQVIPIKEIKEGLFINKNYIREIMGNRINLDNFYKEMEQRLPADDWKLLYALINRKNNKDKQEEAEKELMGIFKNIRLRSLPSLFKKIIIYKWQKDADKALLTRINKRLDDNLQNDLDNILKQTNNMDKFLKSIKGRLTKEQAEKLKNMIEERNKEIKQKKLSPINEIILHKTFSFAPFMLLGVIITLLTKTNLIHLIYEYILHR
jgi:hypothetical protein